MDRAAFDELWHGPALTPITGDIEADQQTAWDAYLAAPGAHRVVAIEDWRASQQGQPVADPLAQAERVVNAAYAEKLLGWATILDAVAEEVHARE